MENVTDRVLTGINDALPDNVRDSIAGVNIAAVEKEFSKITHMTAVIKPYYDGNQYWVAITETYKDVRLVGFPPNGIGQFGGDVENWMWPRHTGDFSLFRVYAGADNKPADYAEGNKPYHTDQFFKLNCGGYKEGDFAMVYGFPGTTQEYISSYELKQVATITDPVSIAARTRRLDVWTKHMAASREIFLKYTSKRAQVANGWKKWQGEVKGLELNNVVGKKEAFEKKFQQWADGYTADPAMKTLLPEMKEQAAVASKLLYMDMYNREAALGVELISQGALYEKLLRCYRVKPDSTALTDTLNKVVSSMAGYYKNYDAATDRDVFTTMMTLYFTKGKDWVPQAYKQQYRDHNQDIAAWARDLYDKSVFANEDRLKNFVKGAKQEDSAKLVADPAWALYDALSEWRKRDIQPGLKAYTVRMRYLNRLYMKGQMLMQKTKAFYPNANLTQRLTYGQVKGIDPDGPAKYSWQTTLGDAVALNDSTQEGFTVPKKLRALYKAKDYGRWGVKGTMPLAFTASNHTSGGNSGSPVLNAKGELIGTNFDRAYEGTMSDYYFDPARCRNISVDIRYTLFILDKFGGAGWLIDELKIVGK